MVAPDLMNFFKSFFRRSRTSIEYVTIHVTDFQDLEDFGIVTATIQPRQLGRVEYRATWWNAVCPQDIVLLPGTRVRVIKMVNITLVVEPLVPVRTMNYSAKVA
jgi:membrane protein implicated in regulation of membrane protease activity